MVVLLYHHVDTSTPAITSITPTQFDKHLKIIEAEAFTVLPLGQLLENSQKKVLLDLIKELEETDLILQKHLKSD